MPLSEFEISKITEIVAGKVGAKLDAKTLRHVIDAVIDNLKKNQANSEIKGVTCEEGDGRNHLAGFDKNLHNDKDLESQEHRAPDLRLDKKEQEAVGRVQGSPQVDEKPDIDITSKAVSRPSTSRGIEPDKKHLINQMPTSSSGSIEHNKILPPDEQLVPNEGGLYEQIEKTDATRVIIAAFGKNRPGIVAAITKVLADLNCSIEDISQTIMQEFFSMIMIVDIKDCPLDFSALRDKIKATETQLGMQVYVMHEDIFRYMHRI